MWINIKLVLFFLMYFSSMVSLAQSKTDSLKMLWQDSEQLDSLRFNAIYHYYRLNSFAQPDSALIVADFHYSLARENESAFHMVRSLREKAKLYFIKGEYTTSMDMLDEALDLAPQLSNPVDVASVYDNRGIIYNSQNKFQEAIRSYSDALKIYQAHNSKSGEASAMNNIGILYHEIGNFELSLEYLNKSLLLYKQLGRNSTTGFMLANIAEVKYKQEKFKESISQSKNALDIFLASNNRVAESDAYFVIAKSFRKLNLRDSAFIYANKSVAIDREINSNSSLNKRLTLIANLAFETNVQEATKQGEAILKKLTSNAETELKAEVYQLLYKCYKAQGKSGQSLEMYEKYSIYNESLQKEKSNFL